ncbi:hypothetical protein ES708_23299 [subsurface metagenome]
MKYKPGEQPGAFVLTARRDGKKYVMSEATLASIVDRAGEVQVDFSFKVEWQVLTAVERGLADEIRRRYFT